MSPPPTFTTVTVLDTGQDSELSLSALFPGCLRSSWHEPLGITLTIIKCEVITCAVSMTSNGKLIFSTSP